MEKISWQSVVDYYKLSGITEDELIDVLISNQVSTFIYHEIQKKRKEARKDQDH